MRVEHLFDIYAKLYMPTHHFEFYASFFFYALVTCSVLWCVVYVIFSCGKHIHKRPCLSVNLSVRSSVPAFASTFYHRLPWYFIIWLETPTACGSQIFKVIWQISRSHKYLVKRVKLRVLGHFLGNAWGKGLKYRMLMYPDHLIKSPRYTGGDLYRGWLFIFVPVRTPPPPPPPAADSCSRKNFWTTS